MYTHDSDEIQVLTDWLINSLFQWYMYIITEYYAVKN
jgi:hypothetical protein